MGNSPSFTELRKAASGLRIKVSADIDVKAAAAAADANDASRAYCFAAHPSCDAEMEDHIRAVEWSKFFRKTPLVKYRREPQAYNSELQQQTVGRFTYLVLRDERTLDWRLTSSPRLQHPLAHSPVPHFLRESGFYHV